jgi:hypothetical protein
LAKRLVDERVFRIVGGRWGGAVRAIRSASAARRRVERRWFASTLRAVAYSHTRAASRSGMSSTRRHAVKKTSAVASCASPAETGAPAAVGDDVRVVRLEQRVKSAPALTLCFLHRSPPAGHEGTIRRS